jgi:hypothetical protein
MTDWFDRPMRWAQLTLVENDPDSFDVQFWLDYIQSSTQLKCLFTVGVPGWVIKILLEIWWKAAGGWIWSLLRAPIHMLYIRK